MPKNTARERLAQLTTGARTVAKTRCPRCRSMRIVETGAILVCGKCGAYRGRKTEGCYDRSMEA